MRGSDSKQDDMLFRWFVGVNMDEEVWVPTVFTKNRDRLLKHSLARSFFQRVLQLADKYLSDEHFTVDGTLLEAWASLKSFQPKNKKSAKGSPPVPPENSVRINPHPCGTLIADLVDALSLLASTAESKDWQSLPRPVVECIQVQGVRVAKESAFD